MILDDLKIVGKSDAKEFEQGREFEVYVPRTSHVSLVISIHFAIPTNFKAAT